MQRVVADDGHSVQGGHRQVLPPQQLLQKPDQSAEDAEIGCSAVGHELIVTLETHMSMHRVECSVTPVQSGHILCSHIATTH